MQELKEAMKALELPENWSFSVRNGLVFFYFKNENIFHDKLPKSVINSHDKEAVLAFRKFIQSNVKNFDKKLYRYMRRKYYTGRYNPGIDVKPPTHEDFVDLNTILPEGFIWEIEDRLTAKLSLYHDGEKLFSQEIFNSHIGRITDASFITLESVKVKSILLTANYMLKKLDSHLAKIEKKENREELLKAWDM